MVALFNPLSSQPPFHPVGAERGSEVHILLFRFGQGTTGHCPFSLERRLAANLLRSAKSESESLRGEGAAPTTQTKATWRHVSRRLADATKSNVDFAPPFHPAGVERGPGG